MTFLVSLRRLADEWREKAETLQRYGGDPASLLSCASDLEERLCEWELEELTLEQAETESGLAYDTLQKKVATGQIPNAGRKHAPRIRRGDLPQIRPRLSALRLATGEPDIAEETIRARQR